MRCVLGKKILGSKLAPPTEVLGVVPVKAPTLQDLKPSQQVVVNAYLDKGAKTFLNARQSYKAAHPTAKDSTAGVEGCVTLNKPSIRHVVQHELNVRGLDRAGVLDELAWNVTQSKTLNKLTEHREAVMASAKVQGFLIDKVEQKVVQDQELDEMRKVVSDVLKGESTGS